MKIHIMGTAGNIMSKKTQFHKSLFMNQEQLIHHTAELLGQGDGLRLGAGVQQESQECIRRAGGMLLNKAEKVRVS